MCKRPEKQFKYTERVSEAATVTQLLGAWRQGDEAALRELAELLQPELRRIASLQMSRERAGHTLQPTALVNELYLELLRGVAVDWKDRAHFLAVAVNVLRRILVEHARNRGAAKRGGGEAREELQDGMAAEPAPDEEILDLHRALEELEAMDKRAARVVELRYFGGLTEAETAEAMGVSLSTMKRDWEVARAWLGDRLRR